MSHSAASIELWGGVECTVNRVGDRWFDQIAWSGHQGRPEDLDRFASLGIRALRYPVLWERVAPRSLDAPDFTWTDERLTRIRDLGMRPIVGLVHHGSGPAYTSLIDPQFPALLARYARLVAERYPWLTDYTPVNEPLTTARFAGMYGAWFPHARDTRVFVRALLNQLRGVVLAMEAVRSVNAAARLIQTEDCGITFGTKATRPQVAHERDRRWLTWDILTGRVDLRHPLYRFLVEHGASESELAFFCERQCPPAIIGLNYYLTSDRFLDERLDRYPAQNHAGNGFMSYADVEAVRARPGGIVGHEGHLRAAWRRYQLPVALTEVHLSCTREEQLRWVAEGWRGAHNARRAGADVRAVTAWSLLGSFNWDSLVTRDSGHYEPGVFDVRSTRPRPTRLASIISTMSRGGALDDPALDGEPWWRRPQRLLYGQRPSSEILRASVRRILVTGGSGTLGRAFHSICRERGLAVCVVNRRELDITHEADVDAALQRIQPWAVINAAGYVRVDDAETEPHICRRANVMGATTLAAACRRQGVSYVTFSSDLVFDGTNQRPYVESDTPQPINVYGGSKALAEKGVLELLPDALVIRTSAFFGPWDEWNFAVQVVRALSSGGSFAAAEDCVVSPTYVPDLVHATLDLLIDGESGIWHLANRGAVTWYGFAQAIAAAFSLPVDRLQPVFAARARARRPAQSALASERGQVMRPLEAAIDAFVSDLAREAELVGVQACASR